MKKSGGLRKIYDNIIKLGWDWGGCHTAARDDWRMYSHATFSVKNQDI